MKQFVTLTTITLYTIHDLPNELLYTARKNLYHYLDEQWQFYEMDELDHNFYFYENGEVAGWIKDF